MSEPSALPHPGSALQAPHTVGVPTSRELRLAQRAAVRAAATLEERMAADSAALTRCLTEGSNAYMDDYVDSALRSAARAARAARPRTVSAAPASPEAPSAGHPGPPAPSSSAQPRSLFQEDVVELARGAAYVAGNARQARARTLAERVSQMAAMTSPRDILATLVSYGDERELDEIVKLPPFASSLAAGACTPASVSKWLITVAAYGRSTGCLPPGLVVSYPPALLWTSRLS